MHLLHARLRLKDRLIILCPDRSAHKSHYQKLPNGWAVTKLADIAWFGGGKTPSTENKTFWENGTINWITSKDMKEPIIIDSKIKLSAIGASQNTIYPKGTLLMVTRSGILRRTLPLAITGKESTVNQDIKTITTPFYGITEYLYWYFIANENEILEKYQKDGTTVESIDFEKFQNIELLLPPLEEQERIIKQLKSLLQLIEVLSADSNRIKTAIERTKSKILDLAMQGKLVPQDPADEPAADMLLRINPKAKIITDNPHYPNNWVICPIGCLLSVISGVSYSKNDILTDSVDAIRILRGGNIQDGKLWIFDDDVFISKNNVGDNNRVKAGDILMVASTGSVLAIGKTAYVQEVYDNVHIGAFLRILRPSNQDFAKYLSLFFQSKKYKAHIQELAKGSNINNIKASYITDMQIGLPPLYEQKRIVAKIEELYSVLDEIESSLQS